MIDVLDGVLMRIPNHESLNNRQRCTGTDKARPVEKSIFVYSNDTIA